MSVIYKITGLGDALRRHSQHPGVLRYQEPVITLKINSSKILWLCCAGQDVHGNHTGPGKLIKKRFFSNSETESERVSHSASCLTLCDPMDCSLTDSSVLGISQARILDWVAISFYRGRSQPRDWTWISCTAERFFTFWAIREAPIQRLNKVKLVIPQS